jgi:uncharacterized protein (UPF0303 family)
VNKEQLFPISRRRAKRGKEVPDRRYRPAGGRVITTTQKSAVMRVAMSVLPEPEFDNVVVYELYNAIIDFIQTFLEDNNINASQEENS